MRDEERSGPPCTCVLASDTGHPPECPRADWARGAVVRPAPDPARDARVAARRADDARRAGRALDALLADRSANECSGLRCTCCGVLSDYLWRVRPSTCGACPDDCNSCTRDGSDCECYEHQDNYKE